MLSDFEKPLMIKDIATDHWEGINLQQIIIQKIWSIWQK